MDLATLVIVQLAILIYAHDSGGNLSPG